MLVIHTLRNLCTHNPSSAWIADLERFCEKESFTPISSSGSWIGHILKGEQSYCAYLTTVSCTSSNHIGHDKYHSCPACLQTRHISLLLYHPHLNLFDAS